jgi:hypothetical protein
MRTTNRSRVIAVLVAATTATGMLSVGAAGASPTPRAVPRAAQQHAGPPSLPQTATADRAAAWLASKVNAKGYVVSSGSPDLSDTTLTILALAATKTEGNVAHRALTYVEHHVGAYVQESGVDRPGELATLILDAHELGANPRDFGGTNLVMRLLHTLQTSGPDAGLFGVQDPTYDGAYRQGLSLMALAAVGETKRSVVGAAVTWLQHQQCSNGAWEAYRSSTAVPCTKTDPTTYSGPDTNSTALAIEGLTSQHAAFAVAPLHALVVLEASSGGWGYYGGPADPDSTALVVQAILALHGNVAASPFTKGSRDPVSAILSFELRSGAFYFPGSRSANGLSTEQVVPALVRARY